MTPGHAHDWNLNELARLPLLVPDHAWTDRVRTQCHTRLSRRQKGLVRPYPIVGFGRRVFAPVVAGCFCIVYVAALVATALRLYGVFR